MPAVSDGGEEFTGQVEELGISYSTRTVGPLWTLVRRARHPDGGVVTRPCGPPAEIEWNGSAPAATFLPD
ncbi:hypothetical protein [Lentzea sp. NEAU-D7]|uniref:hypothetical protein n=1 Tax=Lentzea sp. NEAU-D7 TaxID=2994667 RepID=UPI00224B6EE0|nr:hypothetical protein [Lentzea sp. NEAU-D7]MCX2948664.1 hypothetical protein [Lentzea sp. NEAU-D7]MCX2951222.1 hypothetical protein [Lentzea sp. NEAU-D7]